MNRSRVTGDLASQGNIFVDIANDRVGIGSTIPTQKLDVTGTVKATAFSGDGSNLDGINTDLVSDTSPQLGGNLDVQAREINTSTTNGNIKLTPNGTGVVEVKGAGGNDGTLQLNCSANSHGIKLKSPPHSAAATYTLTFPNTDGNANQVLKSDGSGNLDWVSITDSNCSFVDLTLTDTDAGSAAGPELKLFRNSASPADADYLGQIKFAGESDTGVERNYAKITGKILDASNGTEDGIIEFAHIKAGSQTITGRWRSDSLQLLNDTNLTVDGNITVNNLISLNSDDSSPARIDLYCESGNAHYTRLQAPAHSTYSGNVTVTIPNTSGNLAVLANAADNRVVTATGTHGMTGESTLTYNGSGTLEISSSGSSYTLRGAGSTKHEIGASASDHDLVIQNNKDAGNITSNIIFKGSASGGATVSEKMRINSAGVRMGGSAASALSAHSAADDLVVGGTSSHGITILTGDATGNIFFNNGSGNNGIIQYVHSTNPDSMIINSAGQIEFDCNGAERLRIDTSGRLLLGTTTEGNIAADNFTVAGSGDEGITIRSGTSNSGNLFFSDGTSGGDEYRGYLQYQHSNNKLSIGTNASTRLALDGDGRVLIGLNSDTRTTSLIISGNSSTGATGQAVLNMDIGTTSISDGTSIGVFRFGATGDRRGADIRAEGAGTWSAGSSHPTDLLFGTNASGSASTPTERLRITSTGRFGINNDSPQYVMHASHNGQGGNERIDLHMTNDTTGHNSNDGVQFGYQNTAGAYIWNFEDTTIYFATNNTERLRITADGNVNINSSGVSSPYSSFRHISINNNLFLNAANSAGGFAGMQNNAYLNSSGSWVRVNNDHATSIGTDDGNFFFRNAGSGTGAISWNMPVKIQTNNRINIGEGNSGSPLGAVHINTSSTMGTDTALWIGDNANKRYMAIFQNSNTEQFSHMLLKYNDNGSRSMIQLSNPYGPAGYGSAILWRGYNEGTQAYIETKSEGANNANASMYIYTSGNKGLRIRHSGTVQAQEALVSRNGIVQINQVTSTTRFSGSMEDVDIITGSTFSPKTNNPRFLIMIFLPVNTSDDSDAHGQNINPYYYGRIEFRKNGGSWTECNNQGSTSNQGGFAAHIEMSPNRTGNDSGDFHTGDRYRCEHKQATVLATNIGDCGDGGTVQFKLRGRVQTSGRNFVQIGQPHGFGTDDDYPVQPWGFTVFELAPDSNSYTPY